MNGVTERLQKMIWFMPLDKFAMAFAIFVSVSTFSMAVFPQVGFFQAFFMSLLSGVILTVSTSAMLPLWRFEKQGMNEKPLAWRLLFGPIQRSGNSGESVPDMSDDNAPDSGGDGDPMSGIEDEEFRQRMWRNRVDSLNRAKARMTDKIIHTGLVLVVLSAIYWLAVGVIAGFFTALFGTGAETSALMLGPQADLSFETQRDLFIFDLWVIVVIWYILIVLLPRWLVYALFFAMAGMRIVFLVFGPMASMWIMHMGQLPFFYGLMMVFMFGSIIYPFLRQIKFYRPGDANWGTPKGSMRGQPEVRATVEIELAKFQDYIDGKSKRRPTRGMIFEGPPGTGKTLYAKEIATEFNLPFIMADGASLVGVPLISLVIEYIKWRVHSFASEYGGAVFFIDEAEVLFQSRPGMGGGPGFGIQGSNDGSIQDVWDLLPYNAVGATTGCGVVYDSAQTRERFWSLKSPLALGKDEKQIYTNPFFFPVGGMGGGAGAIFPFLTWMDGVGSPPAMETLKIRILNDIIDGFFVIPTHVRIGKWEKILRFAPAKPVSHTVLFIGATNRAFMLDSAISREGRMGISARFKTPDFESRSDIIRLYFNKAFKDGFILPELLEHENVTEFSRATSGMSPAEIEAAINRAYDVRLTHIKNLKRIKDQLDGGVKEEDLLEQDHKYWMRYESELNRDDWDDDRADMHALLEARNTQIYGRADPGRTTDEHREQTARHEYYGHGIILKATLGDVMRPAVISVLPRGNALGMVAHIPIEERDPKPKHFYEGLVRVSVGSTVAERFFYGENQPGVAGDLENATRVACYMVGKVAMPPYDCSEDMRDRYAEIGRDLIAVSDNSMPAFNPFAQGFVEQVLSNPRLKESVAVILGQAFVDDYRIIRVNYASDSDFHENIVEELLRVDELGGARLEQIWREWDDKLITLDQLKGDQLLWWPDKIAVMTNHFYNPNKKSEAEELVPR